MRSMVVKPASPLDIADFERFLVFCKVERSLVEGFALGGRQLAHVVVEARNRHVSVFHR